MNDFKEILISIKDVLVLIKEEQEKANALKEIELGIRNKSDYSLLKKKKNNE